MSVATRQRRSQERTGHGDVLESREPASGALVARFDVAGEEDVRRAVAEARTAAAWWAEQGFDGRRRHLLRFRRELARRIDEIADLVHRENGKPRDDALFEVILALEHLDWAARNARRVLGPRRVSSGMLMANHSAVLEYQPFGVVGVIGPWNYPVFTPMGSVAYALAAGNAVVFKPSEHTPAVGYWLGEVVARAIPEARLLHVVVGGGATGAALCRSGVDKIAFTGSSRSGRAVMAACAETLTPVALELGGKDAVIVDDDADIDAAADMVVWGALQNAGQACISVERVYAVDAVHDRLVEAIRQRAERVRTGGGEDADIGPITVASQVDVIERHLDDALSRGAHAVVGGRESVRRPYVEPVVLTDVPEDSLLMREETFGPVVPIVRVRDAEEALARANGTGFGLAAAIFGRRHARDLASRLRSGMVSVNAMQSYAAIPALPFGGVGESGFGRIHGDDGLREFARPKAVAGQRFPLPVNLTSFDRPAQATSWLRTATKLRHGR